MDKDEKDASLQALTDALNSGTNLPTVDPAELKSVWDIVKRMQAERPGQQVAIGMDAIAASSPTHNLPTMAEGMALMSRATVLSALSNRGVLRDFESDGEVSERVFRTVGTMPLNADDLGEATVQMHAAKPLGSRPAYEEKFLAAVRAARENP